MSHEIVDFAVVYLNGQELDTIESIEVTDTDPGAEVVKTVRRLKRGIGYKRGISEYEVTIEAKKTTPAEVDWLRLKREGRKHLLVYQEGDGAMFHLKDLLVVEVGKTFNAEGEAMDRIRCLALDHKKEGAA
jgi:hypothetical protein